MQKNQTTKTILLAGEGKSIVSIALCLCKAGETVLVLTKNIQDTRDQFRSLLATLDDLETVTQVERQITFITSVSDVGKVDLAIAYTNESEKEKIEFVGLLEGTVEGNITIGINTESIPLNSIQKCAKEPQRVLGVNWVEPAHANFFLELICNENIPKETADLFLRHANVYWDKDAYIVNGNLGIRSKLFSAMAREALYLVENEFASIEDIDRACRNDAGYYMPFAGNLRYMDLMGTKSYGIVMEELNPELANSEILPRFLTEMEKMKQTGLEANQGFYKYEDGSAEDWAKLVNTFSLEVQELMRIYPFDHTE